MPVERQQALDTLAGWGIGPEIAGPALPIGAIAAGLAAGILLELILVRALSRLAARSRTRLDDLVVRSVDGPLKLFGTLLGTAYAVLLTPAPPLAHQLAGASLVVIAVVGAVVVIGRLAGGVVTAYGERGRLAGSSRAALRRLIVIGVWLVGALFVLDKQGVSITPLLTTLGLAGLAVALAFQDTLSNFFAGLYVQADRPLDVGHYVRIEDVNSEGYVVEVGWRTTKIRTLPNNLVVIPNARVASSVVTDYDLPDPRMSVLINVPVARGADPREVERILVEEARAADVPGLRKDPAPFVRFIPGFTGQGMEFTLICQVDKFVDQYLVQHEVRQRILERLGREGFALGYPVRVVVGADGATARPTRLEMRSAEGP